MENKIARSKYSKDGFEVIEAMMGIVACNLDLYSPIWKILLNFNKVIFIPNDFCIKLDFVLKSLANYPRGELSGGERSGGGFS